MNQHLSTTRGVETDWLDRVIHAGGVDELVAGVSMSQRVVARGAYGSSTNLLAGAMAVRCVRPVLLVVAHLDEADDAIEDLERFGEDRLMCRRFGALEVLPGESNVSLELLAERLGLVDALVSGEIKPNFPSVIVAPIQALMQSVPEADAIGEFSLTLERGQEMPPARLLDWLDRGGYSRNELIEQPGDFSVRGGIVDLFTPSAGPIRLDYFGDEIETIRVIETDTMGSGEALESIQLVGATTARLQSDDRTTQLIRLLPNTTLVMLQEVMELSEQARGYYERLTEIRGVYSPNSVFKSLTNRAHVEVNQYSMAAASEDLTVELPIGPLDAFDQDGATAVSELGERSSLGHDVIALCQNDAERDRLVELIREHATGERAKIAVEVGYLHRGFVLKNQEKTLELVPNHELFHRYQARRRIRRIGAATEKAADAFIDLEVGDYVVHVDHGIAKFTGLKTMKRQKQSEDYLTLQFSQSALLHVPATQIDLVQKYIGGLGGGAKPSLSILGGRRWQKQKEQAVQAVKDMAAEMLRIHAARAAMPGVRFPVDTLWQREFEAEFPYQETDDQIAAIAAVKKDMSDEQPMDRLICGDVGFGKTEVAIRAAFKSVENGKQVAVLVPTTVLAEQHERTFRGRMADYPFRVASLSRFKTSEETKTILEQVTAGSLDVVIGTHRLLSKDVKFSDLGLVIIDEEQRFGVEHKQKLLSFRLTADVMTLSATPIPRTLHMAMLGLRDISSLSTAPLDRRAVVTEVCPYEGRRIQRAIIRELNREGQVYFVHNRVHNIQSMADKIKKLVPEARLAIGHGQMSGKELESVMLKFMRREIDVLVSTTIIESGIDNPTANTMFINDADHYGLADLHQLRGRVGRYKHRAYCYLLLSPTRTITETAQRRLKAIEQYSMLGAGFKIAMRDLEIRGAGNLLGAEQSGHIAAVGYEMYCKMLDQETRKLRHETVVEPAKTHLELPIAGRIPNQYIASEKYRMDAYKRLSRASTMDEYDAIVEDLADAYGKPPATMQALLDLTELRIAVGTLGVTTLKLDGPDLIFRTDKPAMLSPYLKDAPGRVSVIDDKTVYYRPPSHYLEPVSTLLAILRKWLCGALRGRER